MISPKNFIRTTEFLPKKRFGQNFLVHLEGAQKIVKFAGITPDDFVLEIGPGLAALTTALLDAGAQVTSIEKDVQLVEELKKNGPQNEKFHLIHQDALEFQFSQLETRNKKWKVVANLPYSISTPLLEMLLNQIDSIESMVLLFQEELVDRICASPGGKDFGRLSVWVQMLCETERGFRVPSGSFYPVPDVESRLVKLIPRKIPLVPKEEQTSFLEFVAKAFQHRRKIIRNSIQNDPALAKANIDPQRRPETLSVQEFYALLQGVNQTS